VEEKKYIVTVNITVSCSYWIIYKQQTGNRELASLLFVDNPVGAGYSYVDSDDVFLIFHSSLLPVCCL
jgi:hypothetical protein